MEANESLESQVQRLADHILNNCEGYPNENEGAIDCAIRIIKASTPTNQQRVTDEEIREKAEKACVFNYSNGRVTSIDEIQVDGYIIGYKQAMQDRLSQLPEGEGKKDYDLHLNMQYYMEYCQKNEYIAPQDWISKHKHF